MNAVARLHIPSAALAKSLGAENHPPKKGPYILIKTQMEILFWAVIPGALEPLPPINS